MMSGYRALSHIAVVTLMLSGGGAGSVFLMTGDASAQAGGAFAQAGGASPQAGGAFAQAGGASPQAGGVSAQAGGASAQAGGAPLPAVTATGKDATRAPTAMGAIAPQASASVPAFYGSQSGAQWMASKLIGATVVGVDDKAVGAITDLVLGQSGVTEGAVIGVGGFLGVGEKKVAVPFARLDVVRGEDGKVDKIRLAMSRDELERAPTFVTLAEQKSKAKADESGKAPK